MTVIIYRSDGHSEKWTDIARIDERPETQFRLMRDADTAGKPMVCVRQGGCIKLEIIL